MKTFLLIPFIVSQTIFSQSVSADLEKSVKEMMSTSNALSANLSFYVSDEKGNLVYEFNGNKGLSTASTQKIFTSIAALETLGKNYQFKTTASYSGKISNGNLDGDFYITSNGDPTLGSWRFEVYKPENFKQKLIEAVKKSGIKKISGNLIVDDSYFDFQSTPGGWPWNDLGNYYGAGVWGLNWRENQFDIQMYGKEMRGTNINLPNVEWVNDVKTEGNSDNSLIFTAPHSNIAYINGTLPGKSMTISGATPNPPLSFGEEIRKFLKENKIEIQGKITSTSQQRIEREMAKAYPKNNEFFSYTSPKLSQIIYWFLKKSVNLYGENIIKTLAKEKMQESNFPAGISYMKNFWKSKGIHEKSINFADGSGLSPQNYVSTKAEVQALLYAQKQPWFKEFFDGFSTQDNGMKMKSGTMKNTKSYAGIHGNYIFSIIINNYQGNNSSEVLQKVLSPLK